VLAGPEGSIAELEVRRESAGGKIIRTPLNRISTAGAGGGILAGGVATLPPRRPAASTGEAAGEAEKRAREEGAREERLKRFWPYLFSMTVPGYTERRCLLVL
jgi:hypothetical protein